MLEIYIQDDSNIIKYQKGKCEDRFFCSVSIKKNAKVNQGSSGQVKATFLKCDLILKLKSDSNPMMQV